MDLSDVGVRHNVAFSTLNIHHSLDISPSVLSVAKEVRNCVLILAAAFATVRIVQAVLVSNNSASAATGRKT